MTDGLRAEREQGITIDVAYRYFADRAGASSSSPTPRATCSTRATWSPARRPPTWRSSSSTPATAWSSRPSATPSSPRCCGIPHLVVCVNKMDLVELRARRPSTRSSRDFCALRAPGSASRTSTFIPISALRRRQRRRSLAKRCPGTAAPPLLEHLETVEVAADRNLDDVAVPDPVGHPRPRTPTTAATPGRSPAACCVPATRSPSCPAACRRRIASIDTVDGPLERGVPADVGHGPARRRRRRLARRRADRRGPRRPRSTASSRPTSAGWPTRPLRAGARLAVKQATRPARGVVDGLLDRLDIARAGARGRARPSSP